MLTGISRLLLQGFFSVIGVDEISVMGERERSQRKIRDNGLNVLEDTAGQQWISVMSYGDMAVVFHLFS